MSEGPPYHRHPFERLIDAAEDLPGGELLGHGAQAVEHQVERGMEALTERIGGPARVRVVVLLAAVLGLAGPGTGAGEQDPARLATLAALAHSAAGGR